MKRVWGAVWIVSAVLAATVGAAQQSNPSVSEAWVAEPAAGAAEIVEGPADGAKTVKELSVPAYGRAELKPGAVRIRLKDLKKPLKAGDTVALALTTDGGTTMKVSAEVRKN